MCYNRTAHFVVHHRRFPSSSISSLAYLARAALLNKLLPVFAQLFSIYPQSELRAGICLRIVEILIFFSVAIYSIRCEILSIWISCVHRESINMSALYLQYSYNNNRWWDAAASWARWERFILYLFISQLRQLQTMWYVSPFTAQWSKASPR